MTEYVYRPCDQEDLPAHLNVFHPAVAAEVRRFHSGMPGYAETPLRNLKGLAGELGLRHFCIKDESFRFGLNAFKVLGGSYAMARILAEKMDLLPEEMTFERLIKLRDRAEKGETTFITATDGNHGRGVAYMAAQLHQNCIVLLPAHTAPDRVRNIAALGANALVTDLAYDDAVRLAARMAEERGYVLVQDTAWPGYEQIPLWIMQGYMTMADECLYQMPAPPTHLFLQAGVGSMAAAVAAYFSSACSKSRMKVILVEPDHADCFARTAHSPDGSICRYPGEMNSMMAGLCCGEPCPLAWEILRRRAAHYVTISDATAALGMRVLGNPLSGDHRIVSGESGASSAGFVIELMRSPELAALREELRIGKDSSVLCISTEGDTDRENYRAVVWEGRCPYPDKSGRNDGVCI